MRLDTFVWGAILDSSHPYIGSATALPDIYVYKLQCPASPGGQHPGNSLITQIIDLQTLFAINDRQTVQTDTQTDRQVAIIGRDYSRKYLKMRLMVGKAEGV